MQRDVGVLVVNARTPFKLQACLGPTFNSLSKLYLKYFEILQIIEIFKILCEVQRDVGVLVVNAGTPFKL